MMTNLPARFANRVVLVTGAASGIGQATAKRLSDEQASVVLTDKNVEKLGDAFAALPHNERHLALEHNVTLEEDWARVLAAVRSRYGRLDALVNNAGGGGGLRSIQDSSLDDWRRVIALNLDSVFLGTKLAAPLLAENGGGVIVNVSSIRAMVVGPASSAYAAAKAGVRLFTKAAAVEFAAANMNVRVNSLHPGFVSTTQSAGPDYYAEIRAAIPMQRLARPDEMAAAIAFMAADDASYMNAGELLVDGAFTAR